MNVLIVALDAVLPAEVLDAEVLVVAPALNSRLRRWLSDEDEARRRAEQRARAIVDLLARGGVHAEGRAGDADPLLAIADALATFAADEIVIAGRRNRCAGSKSSCRARAAASRFPFAPPIRLQRRRKHPVGIAAGPPVSLTEDQSTTRKEDMNKHEATGAVAHRMDHASHSCRRRGRRPRRRGRDRDRPAERVTVPLRTHRHAPALWPEVRAPEAQARHC